MSGRPEYIKVVEPFLPYGHRDADGRQVFAVARQEFISHLDTESSCFPYLRKEISKGS